MKHFRVKLFEGSNTCCDAAVIAAAYINGGYSQLDLKSVAAMAEAKKEEQPEFNRNTSIELIGDNLLHIDTKINGEYKTVCIIQEVQIMEIHETLDDLKEVF